MKKPRVLIFTPFRNEDHSLPFYLKALRTIDYPHDLIDVLWIENDSWDDTHRILKEAKDTFDFRSVKLHSILIHGLVRKGVFGAYRKQEPQGRGRVATAWMSIWNDNLIPILKTSTAPYVLVWFADVIPPPNIITEYLKAFEQYPDVGWVGGQCHRRFPWHTRPASPDKDATEIVRVRITAHCWMSPREAVIKAPMYHVPREMFLSIINDMHSKQGLKVYYQPSVYLTHISTDGKIYRYDEERGAYIDPKDRGDPHEG
jgi:hypothetical protein